MDNSKIKDLLDNIEKVIVGKTEKIKFLITGLLTNSHVLIEDVPGLGKTMLALSLSKSVSGKFKRIQFTPDLLPSDVTGGYVYNPKSGEFDFREGPIFANIVLSDEINRTTPRTQSALLECMQEYKATIDGKTFILPQPFMVIATQNPIEYQGTYPLPEAQVDRFLMKINMGYPTEEEEVKVISGQKQVHPVETLSAVMSLEEVVKLQEEVKRVQVMPNILNYIVKIISLTRKRDDIKVGASPRASISLMKASCAWAFIEGRDYVIPDDVTKLATWILQHRISLEPKSLIVGKTAEMVIAEIIKEIPIP